MEGHSTLGVVATIHEFANLPPAETGSREGRFELDGRDLLQVWADPARSFKREVQIRQETKSYAEASLRNVLSAANQNSKPACREECRSQIDSKAAVG